MIYWKSLRGFGLSLVTVVFLLGLMSQPWARGERFGSIAIDKDGEISVYDGKGFEMPRNIDGPPPGVTDFEPVGKITAEFYQGSCWIKICQGGQCEWYFWPGEGCPF